MLNPFKIFRDVSRLRKEANVLDKKQGAECPVCACFAPHLDSVEFNKSCEEARGRHFVPSGKTVDYCLCDECGFCFAPEFRSWSIDDFERLIYNQDYELVDPDYKFERPNNNAQSIKNSFGSQSQKIHHLDYGGGSGLLSDILRQSGWKSQSYDPYSDRSINPEQLGQFDLITAFEVFEHVPDVNHLFNTLKALCKPKGLIFFTTLVSDGNIERSKKLDWWYAAPRNGHISLFSQKSLRIMAEQSDFQLTSYSSLVHFAYTELPEWAEGVVGSM
jgi:SAM-dependent methyltransferase